MKKEKTGIKISRKLIVMTIVINTVIICTMAVLSVFIYRYVIEIEQNNCWEVLEDSAAGIDNLVSTQVEDNINILKLVSDAMIQEDRLKDTEENLIVVRRHMKSVQEMTMFSRIDILFDDGKMLQEGELRNSDIDFQVMADKGIHISDRVTDTYSGKECVQFVVPVARDDKAEAILRGVVLCEDFPKIFDYEIYDGKAIICLVDRPSGDFIMDEWHDTFGNVYNEPMRKRLSGYENVDPRKEILHGNAGVVAFESKVNGKVSYMYFRPIEELDWAMTVAAQEDVVFERMHIVKTMLVYIGIMESILLVAYLIWTTITLNRMLKKQVESEEQRYIDGLTGVYNRNKYNQTIEEYELMNLRGIGIIFFDMNDLKSINDIQGHDAGDEAIKSAASILSKHFGSSVYRIGGDEFVVCVSNIAETSFSELEELIRKETQEQHVNIAIGATWRADSNTLKEQIQDADQRMYEDKRTYYKNHPEHNQRSSTN